MENNITTNLVYKDHRDFFSKYMDYRSQCFEGIAICLNDKTKVVKTFQLIYLLYGFTSNYISNSEEIKKELFEIQKIIETNPKQAVLKMSDLMEVINEKHEESELLPKKQIKQDVNRDFWKLEHDLILRQIKKAGVDILCKSD